MQKNKTKSKNKAVAGQIKHKSFKLTPKSFGIGLALLIMVLTFGALGYNKVKHGSYTAQAYTYQTVYNDRGVVVSMCKYQVSAGWGFRAYTRKTGSTQYTNIRFNATPWQSSKQIILSTSNGFTSGLANSSVDVVGSGSNFSQPLISITTSTLGDCNPPAK